MKLSFQRISVFFLILFIIGNILPVAAIDTLEPADFELDNWSKTIDFFDYVRQYASIHGKTPPPDTDHAYLNLDYVNFPGLKMLSAGLINITDEVNEVMIPIQTTMMAYKSKEELKDVVTASSFVMLMAFNETENSDFNQSPDRSDTLYASFSLGYDLNELFNEGNRPDLNSSAEAIPLESSSDGLTWTWGMRYNNLAAFWWKTSIDPNNPIRDPRPIALTIYDELTFNYTLEINPISGEAELSMNYTIGSMSDLWIFWWLIFLPVTVHYNATGCYRLNGALISEENIHDFLSNHSIKMSIVNFQATVVLDHSAYFESEGKNVQDNDVNVVDTLIEAFADDGEKLYDADFSTKKNYNLFDYSLDNTETDFETYQTNIRTTKISGFARNPIFVVHTSLLRLIPTVLASMNPELYDQAKDHLLDMSYADYFYIITYPEYNGFRIEHDPTITAYCALTEDSIPDNTAFGSIGAIVLVFIVILVVVAIIFLKKRK